MPTTEPASSSPAIVFIGKNSRGQWVARARNGLFGGLFVSRQAALRYALFENDHHSDCIVAAAALELDIDVKAPEIASGAPSRRAA